jgi:hypothetical protein
VNTTSATPPVTNTTNESAATSTESASSPKN